MIGSTCQNLVRHTFVVAMAALLFAAALPTRASAQGFVSPFLGYDFSGDSGCPSITDCENKKLNWGAGFGALGSVLGFELDFGYADNFFGKSRLYTSSVFTATGNLMLAPRLGFVQPYALAGLGLIQSKVDTTVSVVSDTKNNDFGWDVGGGLMVFFGVRSHVGLRADVRHFHSFHARQLIGLPPKEEDKLDFGRFSGAIVFRF